MEESRGDRTRRFNFRAIFLVLPIIPSSYFKAWKEKGKSIFYSMIKKNARASRFLQSWRLQGGGGAPKSSTLPSPADWKTTFGVFAALLHWVFSLSFWRGDRREMSAVMATAAAMVAFEGTTKKCSACGKTVYPVEELPADGKVYHRACFRCQHCKCTLKFSSYISYEGVLYCKPHYDKFFRKAGSFGKNSEGMTRVSRVDKPNVHESILTSKISGILGGTQEKCVACDKTVYPIEKVVINGNARHRACFKCNHGGCVINPSNYIAHEGRLYCKHHHSQLFMAKGDFTRLEETFPQNTYLALRREELKKPDGGSNKGNTKDGAYYVKKDDNRHVNSKSIEERAEHRDDKDFVGARLVGAKDDHQARSEFGDSKGEHEINKTIVSAKVDPKDGCEETDLEEDNPHNRIKHEGAEKRDQEDRDSKYTNKDSSNHEDSNQIRIKHEEENFFEQQDSELQEARDEQHAKHEWRDSSFNEDAGIGHHDDVNDAHEDETYVQGVEDTKCDHRDRSIHGDDQSSSRHEEAKDFEQNCSGHKATEEAHQNKIHREDAEDECEDDNHEYEVGDLELCHKNRSDLGDDDKQISCRLEEVKEFEQKVEARDEQRDGNDNEGAGNDHQNKSKKEGDNNEDAGGDHRSNQSSCRHEEDNEDAEQNFSSAHEGQEKGELRDNEDEEGDRRNESKNEHRDGRREENDREQEDGEPEYCEPIEEEYQDVFEENLQDSKRHEDDALKTILKEDPL